MVEEYVCVALDFLFEDIDRLGWLWKDTARA